MTAQGASSLVGAAGEIRSRYRLGDYAAERAALPLPASGRGGPLPLPMRTEMFWGRQNFAAHVPLHLTIIRRLLFRVDVEALRRAVNALVRRHEPLRSMLTLADGVPAQLVQGDFTADVQLADVSGFAGAAADAEESRQVIEFSQQALDLLTGPTFRIRLIRVSDGNHVLALMLHHYFGDAKSMQVLFADLMALYEAVLQERDAGLPELSWQYLDYALWQRNFADANLEKYLAHWEKRSADAVPLGLSQDGAADNRRTAMTSFLIPDDLTARLEALAAQARTTAFPVLLAAYQFALARFAGRKEVVTAIPVAARLRPHFADTVGYLLNAVPIRTRAGDGNILEIIGGFSKSLMGEYFHQDISYEIFEHVLSGPKPLCTTMFNYIPRAFYQKEAAFCGGEIAEFSSPAYDVAVKARPRVRIVKDFIIYLGEAGGGLEAFLMYNPDFLDAGRIEEFAGLFQAQLRDLARAV